MSIENSPEKALLSLSLVQRENESKHLTRAVTLLLFKNVDVDALAEHVADGGADADWETAFPEDDLPLEQKQNLYISRLLPITKQWLSRLMKRLSMKRSSSDFYLAAFVFTSRGFIPLSQLAAEKNRSAAKISGLNLKNWLGVGELGCGSHRDGIRTGLRS